MNPKVNVLISTYNGEKYVREQVDSILSQTYSNIYIYIRDDGSCDQTPSILKDIYGANRKVVLFLEENIGYRKSFLKLLLMASEGDYWAFCDQDDVWMPDKIQWAVEWLKQQDREVPCLFHSSYYLTSEDLKNISGKYIPPSYQIDFRRAITDCVFQGFSITLNRKLREMLLMCDVESKFAHDWMAGLIALEFGTAYFDDRIASLHRRMKNSASAMTIQNRIRWFRKSLSGNSDIRNTAREFYRVFTVGVSTENNKVVKKFALDSPVLLDRLWKAFYPKRWRQSFLSELSIRVLMIMGKI